MCIIFTSADIKIYSWKKKWWFALLDFTKLWWFLRTAWITWVILFWAMHWKRLRKTVKSYEEKWLVFNFLFLGHKNHSNQWINYKTLVVKYIFTDCCKAYDSKVELRFSALFEPVFYCYKPISHDEFHEGWVVKCNEGLLVVYKYVSLRCWSENSGTQCLDEQKYNFFQARK